MIKLATDENFNGKILRGVLRRNPQIDIVRIQDSPVYQADDPIVLAWAAQENRILLTHDIRTMAAYAFERIEQSLPMSGLFQVSQAASNYRGCFAVGNL
ncbi:hypothetical protein MNBD_CHLOROFLEXI01-1032 [hydrothermal vent metagenome]|uniref:DUF5615 domain-containing protein n=1 Tax=hydrothermal vent metagenome TaxID=652676 RepID=A0A3B0V3W3_9ZZZZ